VKLSRRYSRFCVVATCPRRTSARRVARTSSVLARRGLGWAEGGVRCGGGTWAAGGTVGCAGSDDMQSGACRSATPTVQLNYSRSQVGALFPSSAARRRHAAPRSPAAAAGHVMQGARRRRRYSCANPASTDALCDVIGNGSAPIRGVVGRGRGGGDVPPLFSTGGTRPPPPPLFGLKFVQKFVHCCKLQVATGYLLKRSVRKCQ